MFEFLDEDGNGTITVEEFEALSFLFNFEGTAMRQIFKEFDVCDDQVMNDTIMNLARYLSPSLNFGRNWTTKSLKCSQ